MNSAIAFIIGSIGAFMIVASILNLDIITKGKRADFYQKILGKTGTRIFYIILGIFIVYIATQLMG